MRKLPIAVHRLTPARGEDYLRFFDHERGPAFADNPEWAKCYCHYYHVPKALDWPSFDGEANRAAMGARIASGEMEGYLAYRGEDVIGWVNAQPLHKLPHCFARLGVPPPLLEVPPHEAAAIVCFVVAPDARRTGVASALLTAALKDLAARGVRVVDAFPFNTTEGDEAATDHYHGPLQLFRRAGFEPVARHENVTVVRKLLGDSSV